jgi:hypothetical protein
MELHYPPPRRHSAFGRGWVNLYFYEPLAWALAPVQWCLRHDRPLLAHCPRCRRTQAVLLPHARSGWCAWCGQWLGDTSSPAALRPADARWQAQLAVAVGSLVAAAAVVGADPPREQIAQVVRALMGRGSWCRSRALARRLQVNRSVIQGWCHGRQVPQLENLVRLSVGFGTAPANVLTDAITEMRQQRVLPRRATGIPARQPRAPVQRRDWSAVANVLQTILDAADVPPPSVAEVGRRLGIGAHQLRWHCPAECRTLTARYQAYVRVQGRLRREELALAVRQAVLQLHTLGVYPAMDRVAQQLGAPGARRAPEVRAIWRATLHELGWDGETTAGANPHTAADDQEA